MNIQGQRSRLPAELHSITNQRNHIHSAKSLTAERDTIVDKPVNILGMETKVQQVAMTICVY